MKPAYAHVTVVARNIVSFHLARYQARQGRGISERSYVTGIADEMNAWLKANGYRGLTLHDVRKAETFACGSFSYVEDFAQELTKTIATNATTTTKDNNR